MSRCLLGSFCLRLRAKFPRSVDAPADVAQGPIHGPDFGMPTCGLRPLLPQPLQSVDEPGTRHAHVTNSLVRRSRPLLMVAHCRQRAGPRCTFDAPGASTTPITAAPGVSPIHERTTHRGFRMSADRYERMRSQRNRNRLGGSHHDVATSIRTHSLR